VHVLVALCLIGVVLLQRSEGGALGIGGGGGGLMSGRGAANALTRATSILAACFLTTSAVLAALLAGPGDVGSVLDRAPAPAPVTAPGDLLEGVEDGLDGFTGGASEGLSVGPAAPSGADVSVPAPTAPDAAISVPNAPAEPVGVETDVAVPSAPAAPAEAAAPSEPASPAGEAAAGQAAVGDGAPPTPSVRPDPE
ncbi:MAG: preprotein translocase subunit SecG, partial [Pseudomonadota bacterium]